MTPENTAVEKRGPQVAIVPISAIDVKDVASGAAVFDAWLQEMSGGVVTLERIQGVAGALPVVGNIMALVDALGDVVTLTKTEKRPAAVGEPGDQPDRRLAAATDHGRCAHDLASNPALGTSGNALDHQADAQRVSHRDPGGPPKRVHRRQPR